MIFVMFEVLEAAIVLMMEAGNTSTTSVNLYQKTQRKNLDYSYLPYEIYL